MFCWNCTSYISFLWCEFSFSFARNAFYNFLGRFEFFIKTFDIACWSSIRCSITINFHCSWINFEIWKCVSTSSFSLNTKYYKIIMFGPGIHVPEPVGPMTKKTGLDQDQGNLKISDRIGQHPSPKNLRYVYIKTSEYWFFEIKVPSGAISAQAAALLAPPPKPPPVDGVTGLDGFLLLPSETQWTPFLIFFGCHVFQMFRISPTGSNLNSTGSDLILTGNGFQFLNGSFLRLVTTHFNCRLNDGFRPAGHLKSQVFPVQATVTPSLMFNALLFFGSP